MAIRTSEDKVREIVETSLTKEQIHRFMSDASLLVTEEIAGNGPSAARLELIERYLTAALIRLRDLGLSSGKIGDASESYQVDPEVTDYLNRAAAFDTTGAIRRFFLAPKSARTVRARVGDGFKVETGTADVS